MTPVAWVLVDLLAVSLIADATLASLWMETIYRLKQARRSDEP